MNTYVLLTAIFGVTCCAHVTYLAAKHHGWAASGVAALDSVLLLNLVTAGNRSHVVHLVVLIVSVILFFFFFAALTLDNNRSPVKRLADRLR